MVFSDQKPLKNLFEGGMNITKLDRWSLELQEFDISLEFIQGKLNTVADVISHLKNGGLYKEHSKEDQMVNTTTNLDERIKEVLDIASILQVSILRNTYQVYAVPQSLMQ